MQKITYLLTLFSFITVFSQKQTNISQAINIAGKQRMLGQRMAKDKLFIKVKDKKKVAQKEQEIAIKDFEKGISYLKEFAPTKEIKHKIELQEFTYKTYKKLILDNSKESLQEVIACNTLFLTNCDDVVSSIIEYSKEATGHQTSKNKEYVLENIAKATGASGKLRYLTQRLTFYFCLNSYQKANIKPQEIEAIVKTMEKNLNYLTILEFNTLEIDDSLSQILYEWSKLKESIYKDQNINLQSKIKPESLFELCNSILSKANTTTEMYVDLGKS